MDGGDFDSDFLMSSFKILFISFVHGYACVCVSVHTHMCLQVPAEAKRGCGIHWN